MNFKKTVKTIISTSLVILLLLFCGCSGGFDVIEPPLNEFPVANEYELGEVVLGSFVVEKSFRGNFKYDGLYTTNSMLVENGFYEGEKGYVIYQYNNETIKLEATLVNAPESSSGAFVAKHQAFYNDEIKYNWPGEFSIITFQQDNCILAPKNAVWLFDDEGNAMVYTINENEVLIEKQIKVGLSNGEYYQVIEGLTPGEKVVLK